MKKGMLQVSLVSLECSEVHPGIPQVGGLGGEAQVRLRHHRQDQVRGEDLGALVMLVLALVLVLEQLGPRT